MSSVRPLNSSGKIDNHVGRHRADKAGQITCEADTVSYINASHWRVGTEVAKRGGL